MSPNLIDPELERTGKLTKDKNVNQEKETEESKLDSVEEARSSITFIKNKDYIVDKVDQPRYTSVYNRSN